MSASGVLHWFMSNNEVFAFHQDTESWTTFDLPFPLSKKNFFKHTKLAEYNGYLAIFCTENQGEFAQLWVMVDYESKVWMKRYRMSIKAVRGALECHGFPIAMDRSDITLMWGFNSVIYYNFSVQAMLCAENTAEWSFPFPSRSWAGLLEELLEEGTVFKISLLGLLVYLQLFIFSINFSTFTVLAWMISY